MLVLEPTFLSGLGKRQKIVEKALAVHAQYNDLQLSRSHSPCFRCRLRGFAFEDLCVASRSVGIIHQKCAVNLYLCLKVTVHVGTDQNVEIEIFAKYKYVLYELPVKILFFFKCI